jgi:RHS repeat-associated protein
VIDTLGRTPVVTTFSSNQTFLDYLCEQGCNPASGDRARVTLNIGSIQYATHFNYLQQGSLVGEYSGSGDVLSSIVFPDGSSYQFQYDSYGQITGMTLPTGGQISYTYNNLSDFTGYVNRWVTSRTVDGNTWNFAIVPFVSSCTAMPCPQQVTVTTPTYNDGATTAADTHVYTFSTFNGNGAGAWLTQAQYFRGAASGNPVLTKTTDYGIAGACPATPSIGNAGGLPIREQLMWPTGSGIVSKKAEYCYDSYGNRTATKEWDYQPNGNFAAAPDREVDTTYKTDSAYVGANIIKLPLVSTSYGPGHAQAAQTTYGYDETSLQPSNITQNHTTPAGPRGNRTSVSHWLNTNNTSVVSNTAWYDSGEVYQSKDPLGHTDTSYFDSTGAYPNKVCNALNQCSYPVHDFNTGLMASFTDANGSQAGDAAHTTTYTFDNLLRPLCTNLPDGGQTCVSYPDTNHVSKQQKITASLTDASTAVFDDLGRVTQTQHTVPGNISKVDTTYDSVGNPFTVSNPYFTTADATYGITQSFHDALGRVVKTIKQDGSISSSAYSIQSSGTQNGTCVTSTDEAGQQRRPCHNGFGELVEVDEPGGPDPGTQATASVTVSGAFNSASTVPGTPHLAATGTALSSVTMSDGSSHTFYFDSNQHLCHLFWSSGGGWDEQDLTEQTEAALPMTGSSLAATFLSGVVHVFYQGANQHVYDMNWRGSVWQNVDMTVLTGASAMSGTKMSTVLNGGPNSPMMFYEGTDQHLDTVYWNASAAAWQNADLNSLSGSTTLMATKGSLGSVMFSGNTVIYVFYIGANQHLIAILWNGSAWVTGDATNLSGAGGALPVAGSALTTVATGTGIDLLNFYEGPSQHIYSIYWNGTAGAWQTLDFTAFSGATNIAAVQTALTNQIGPSVFYFGSNQHLDDISWNGSAYVNSDLTTLSGTTAVAASGSSISSHGTAAGNTYHIFFEGPDQHIYHTYYSPSTPGWFNQDVLVTTTNLFVDSGTVSMTIPNGGANYTATVCYGVSINPFCAGKPVNASSSDITNALAAALNATGSPVTAVVTNSTTLNLTLRTPGAITATVAAMTSASDYASLFPSGSFTSTSASFSGGLAPSNQSLRNPFITLYAYDPLGNLLRVDQKGSAPSDSSQWRTRTFVYDSLSRLLTATNPESGTITYAYDNDSELLQKTSPAPNQTGTLTQTVSYCYDALRRVTGKAYAQQNCPLTSPVATYFYDQSSSNGLTVTNGIGRRTGMTDQSGTEAWGYDPMGRTVADVRTLGSITKSTTYLYNFLGGLTSITYPSGSTIAYTYDTAARTASAADSVNSINYAALASYSPTGGLSSLKNGSNLTFTSYFNKRLQPCRIFVTTGTSNPTNCADLSTIGNIMDITYGFNLGTGDNGNVMAISNNRDAARSQSFTYDNLNRIVSAQTIATSGTKCFGESFGYDAWSNMLSIGGVNGYSSCTQESLGLASGGKNQISTDPYDAAGNAITGGYSYDAENHLLTAGGVTYSYDGDGKRVKKSSGTLYWYGMGADALDETDLTGSVANQSFNEYAFFNGKRIARRNASKAAFYYFADHLGTSRIITQGGQTAPCYDADFYPFGGERTPVINSCAQKYKFSGKERDSESDLDNFGARFDSASLGRFMSPDTGTMHLDNPQSLNRYSYVLNNPLKYVDPDGKDALPSTVVNTLTNFYAVVRQEMGTLASDYMEGKGMPPSSSAGLQQSIKGFAMFGADRTYPMSSRYYQYEDQVESFLAAQVIDEVQRWINDPKTTAADLEAALVTLSGEDHQSDTPESVNFFSDWIGRADFALKHLGLGGTRNETLSTLERMIEQAEAAKKKQEEEEKKKKEEDCKKDKTKC